MAQLIEKNGKFYKECKVVRLYTDNESALFRKSSGLIEYSVFPPLHGVKSLGWKFQHLYFLSDEKIKEGDWYSNGINVFKCDNLENVNPKRYDYLKKIIATTDSSIKINNPNYDIGELAYINLPKPSKEFIEAYVESYNNGKIIQKVFVEYEQFDGHGNTENFKTHHREFDLKIKDANTIVIKKIEDRLFSELEVVGFLRKYKKYFNLEIDTEKELLFIENNLK